MEINKTSDLFIKEIYSCVCQECSKDFESEDINAEICPLCWEKLVAPQFENEGLGVDKIN